MKENGTKDKTEIESYRGKTPGYASRVGLFDSPFFTDFFGDQFFRPFGISPSLMEVYSREMPKIDIYKKDNAFVMKADFPGVKKEEIKLSVDEKNKTLDLIVDSKTETKDEEKEYLRRERKEIHYHNTYDVSNIDIKKISSKYDNGVLEVVLPMLDVKESKYTSEKKIIEIN